MHERGGARKNNVGMQDTPDLQCGTASQACIWVRHLTCPYMSQVLTADSPYEGAGVRRRTANTATDQSLHIMTAGITKTNNILTKIEASLNTLCKIAPELLEAFRAGREDTPEEAQDELLDPTQVSPLLALPPVCLIHARLCEHDDLPQRRMERAAEVASHLSLTGL